MHKMFIPGAQGGQVEMESPRGFWGLNLGSVQEQQALRLLSLPPWETCFNWCEGVCGELLCSATVP